MKSEKDQKKIFLECLEAEATRLLKFLFMAEVDSRTLKRLFPNMDNRPKDVSAQLERLINEKRASEEKLSLLEEVEVEVKRGEIIF